MKSQASGLLKVVQGIINDYLLVYPHDIKELRRDYSRLTLLVEERGLSVFTLDLPALEAHLLDALESSRLMVSGTLSKRASPTIQVPRLFRGLWLRIFERDGNLKEDADVNVLFYLRSILNIGKKLEVECSSARTKSTLKEYYDVEREIRPPTYSWGNDHLGSDDTCSFDDLFDHHSTSGRLGQLALWDQSHSVCDPSTSAVFRKLQQNCDAFSQAIGQFDPEEFLHGLSNWSDELGFRQGPGAVSDLNSKEYKYDFPTWSEKLGRQFPYALYGRTTGSQNDQSHIEIGTFETGGSLPLERVKEPDEQSEAFPISSYYDDDFTIRTESESSEGHIDGITSNRYDYRTPLTSEPPSRLIAVPKTAKGPRLIAAEPTSHQWCQQLIRSFLENRLSGLFDKNFICFRDQSLSQELVIKASLDKSLATVDLSSASDRLSCWVIERVFRKNQSLLNALHATRTRWVCDTVDKTVPPNYFVLKKFASQGTAVTFPVQSIVFFLCAITASGFVANGPEDFLCNARFCKSIGRFRDKVRVFGDDIIIPVNGYNTLSLILHTLGLKVNQSKSFRKGNFRESCGMDAFKGVNITPIKTKCIVATGPQSRQALLDYSDNLFKAGLWIASSTVASTLPGWVISNLPVIGIGCGGIGRISFCGNSSDHLRTRWSSKYQRNEYRTYRLTTRTKRIPTNTISGVLQYITERPCPMSKWEHGIPGRAKISDGLGWEPLYKALA